MEKIAILTDSTSDLIDPLKEKSNIYVLPLYVNIDGNYLKDGLEIHADQVMDHNKNNPKNIARTSAPSPGDVEEIIKKIKMDGYEKIIIISVSSGLSATYSVFASYARSDENIHLIDSKSASIMESLMVEYCNSLIDSNTSFDEICKKLDKVYSQKGVYIWVNSLENLIKGGRVSAPLGKAISLINIKPMLKISSEGKVELVKLKVKQDKAIDQAINKIVKDLEGSNEYYLGIGYGGDAELLGKIEEKASDLIKNAKTYQKNPFGSVVRAYSGEKAFAIFYLKTK